MKASNSFVHKLEGTFMTKPLNEMVSQKKHCQILFVLQFHGKAAGGMWKSESGLDIKT